jgi:hypothetical protein
MESEWIFCRAIRMSKSSGAFLAQTPETISGAVYYSSTDEHYTTLGISTGLEYHFLKTKRFSPYCGLIVRYENKTSGSTYDDVNISSSLPTIDHYEITNAWMTTYIQYSGSYYSIVRKLLEQGYLKVNINAVLGADFYIFPNFYLGLELGIGYNT